MKDSEILNEIMIYNATKDLCDLNIQEKHIFSLFAFLDNVWLWKYARRKWQLIKIIPLKLAMTEQNQV
jgi:hypothetical protein